MTRIAIGASEHPLPVSRIADLCLEQLSDDIVAITNWSDDDWKVGDFNRIQIIIDFGNGQSVTSELYAEPLEDVRWRLTVSAGPPTVSTKGTPVGDPELARFGFQPTGSAMNWSRDVRVASPRDAEYIARDQLALFTELFGYRALTPLAYTLTWGRRAQLGLLYTALSPQDLRKLMQTWGFRADLGTIGSTGAPILRSGAGGFAFHIQFAWLTPGTNLYSCLNFTTMFSHRPSINNELVNEISRTTRFSRVFLDDDQDLVLERDVNLTGGVADTFLRECLMDWGGMMESVARKLERLALSPVMVH